MANQDPSQSPQYSLNKADLEHIGIQLAAAVISYLVFYVLPVFDFGHFQPLVAMILPVLTYAVRKWQGGQS